MLFKFSSFNYNYNYVETLNNFCVTLIAVKNILETKYKVKFSFMFDKYHYKHSLHNKNYALKQDAQKLM